MSLLSIDADGEAEVATRLGWNGELVLARLRGMWVRTTAVALLVGIGLVGCASDRVATTTARATGTVTGRLGIFGGPLNPATGQMAADNNPGRGMTITATASDGRVARVTTGSDGRFTLRLSPGRYVIASRCGPGVSATVTAGESTVVALRCDVP